MDYIFIMVFTIFLAFGSFPKRPSLRVGLTTGCLFLLVTCTQNRDIVQHSNAESKQNMHSLGRSLNNSCLLSSFHSAGCLIRGYEVKRNDKQIKEGCLSLVFHVPPVAFSGSGKSSVFLCGLWAQHISPKDLGNKRLAGLYHLSICTLPISHLVIWKKNLKNVCVVPEGAKTSIW